MTRAQSHNSTKFITAWLMFLFFIGMAFDAVADEIDNRIELRIEEDLLWLSINDVSVNAAFRAFSESAGYRLYVLGDLSETITIDIDGAPLARAVELLAGQRSTTTTWRSDENGVRRIDEVWVFGDANFAASASLEIAPAPASEISLPSELTDSDPSTRAAAVEQLYGRPKDEAVTMLHQILTKDDAPSVRSAALSALIVIGGDSAYEAISAALADADPELRGDAMQAMAQMSPDKSLMQMAQVLFGDPDPALRRQAASLLNRRQHPAARAILEQAANFHDEGVREAVISAGVPE